MVRTNWKADLLKTTWLQMHSVAFISMDFTTTAVPMYMHVHMCGAVHAFVYIYICMLITLKNIWYRPLVLETGSNIKIIPQSCRWIFNKYWHLLWFNWTFCGEGRGPILFTSWEISVYPDHTQLMGIFTGTHLFTGAHLFPAADSTIGFEWF